MDRARAAREALIAAPSRVVAGGGIWMSMTDRTGAARKALSAAASRVVAGGVWMSLTGPARAARRALTLGAASVAVAGCGGDAGTSAQQLANPASENCVAHGGRLVIETAPAGQYGVCLFEDNRQCEEWALLRGACPSGGIKVTGYATPQARYCAIRGGDYAITTQETASAPEAGTCTLPGQPACDALALYQGRCP